MPDVSQVFTRRGTRRTWWRLLTASGRIRAGVLVATAVLLTAVVVAAVLTLSRAAELGVTAAGGAAGPQGFSRVVLDERAYFLETPSVVGPEPTTSSGTAGSTGAATGAAALVVVLHGRSAAPALFLDTTGLAAALPDDVAVAVGITDPTLERTSWNAGDCCTPATEAQTADLDYLAAMISDARVRSGVRGGPVYLVGFSNGGMLGYRAACERPGLLDALVAVGAQRTVDDCAARPMPLLEIHGGTDQSVPADGADFSELLGLSLRSTAESVRPWFDAAACTAWEEVASDGAMPIAETGPEPDAEPEPSSSMVVLRGARCSEPLEQVLVPEVGHVWPRTASFDATAYVVSWLGTVRPS